MELKILRSLLAYFPFEICETIIEILPRKMYIIFNVGFDDIYKMKVYNVTITAWKTRKEAEKSIDDMIIEKIKSDIFYCEENSSNEVTEEYQAMLKKNQETVRDIIPNIFKIDESHLNIPKIAKFYKHMEYDDKSGSLYFICEIESGLEPGEEFDLIYTYN